MLGSAKALAVEDWCRGEATRVMAVVIIIDKVVLLFVVAVRVITVAVSRHPAERVQLVVQQAQDDHQTAAHHKQVRRLGANLEPRNGELVTQIHQQ